MAAPPPAQVALARKWGAKYGVDPRLLLAIGGHETGWGTLGAGRQGYTLGYGVTDSGILNKYQGVENQYRYAAKTLAGWGAKNIQQLMAGKASAYATDPNWEKGVQGTYSQLSGQPLPAAALPPPKPPKSLAPPIPSRPAPPRFTTRQVYDPGQVAQGIFGSLATGTDPNVATLVKNAWSTQRIPLPPQPTKGHLPGKVQPTGPNVPATGTTAGIVSLAAKQLGQPYVWGGESRKEGGFDCSGLIDWAMRQQGYKGGRITTETIKHMGFSVRGKPLQPGDMILSNHGNHVSIYAGNGKVIVAPHTGAVVRWQPLSDFSIYDVRRV